MLKPIWMSSSLPANWKAPKAANSPKAIAAPSAASDSAASISPAGCSGTPAAGSRSATMMVAESASTKNTRNCAGIGMPPNTGARTNSAPKRTDASSTSAIQAESTESDIVVPARGSEVGGDVADQVRCEEQQLPEHPG